MKKIALIGMMASGKTTISKKLAKILDLEYYCTDDYIEVGEDKKIAEIFKEKGEDYFRKLEKNAVKKLSNKTNIVLSTGGGIVLDKENINLLKSNDFIIILIDRKIENIIQTITEEGLKSRPLIKEDTENLNRIYEERKTLYENYSDISFENNKTMDKVIDDIVSYIKTCKA